MNFINLQFVPVDKVVVKDDTWCQTLGQFIGVHFPNLNPDTYGINNMKFVSTKVKFKWPPGS